MSTFDGPDSQASPATPIPELTDTDVEIVYFALRPAVDREAVRAVLSALLRSKIPGIDVGRPAENDQLPPGPKQTEPGS